MPRISGGVSSRFQNRRAIVSGVNDTRTRMGGAAARIVGKRTLVLERADPAAPHRGRPIHALRAKRLFDVVGAALLLLFFLPFYALVAGLVTLDGGPVLFRHRRIGADGRVFFCLKFRTMVVDAGDRLKQHLAADPAARAEWERCQKLRRDPRVTPTGTFLRRTSLDELPQLMKVLRGDMSLVGPRPIVAEEIRRYGDSFSVYCRCRPGLTGLWQVSRRDSTDYVRRVELDMLYHAHWSLGLDFMILAKTPAVLLFGHGAY